MLHHKEAQQASYDDIGEAAMCTKETAKYHTDSTGQPDFAAIHIDAHK